MTKQELIERVAARIAAHAFPGRIGPARAGRHPLPTRPALRLVDELPKKTIALVIDTVFTELGEYFVKARVSQHQVPRFTYPGFGTFTKKERLARTGRNPRSGELIEIPASTTVGFQPGQELRAELNRPAPRRVKAERHG